MNISLLWRILVYFIISSFLRIVVHRNISLLLRIIVHCNISILHAISVYLILCWYGPVSSESGPRLAPRQSRSFRVCWPVWSIIPDTTFACSSDCLSVRPSMHIYVYPSLSISLFSPLSLSLSPSLSALFPFVHFYFHAGRRARFAVCVIRIRTRRIDVLCSAAIWIVPPPLPPTLPSLLPTLSQTTTSLIPER